MAYDEDLAARVREEMAGGPGVTEKRMFGGLAFLVDGRLACSVTREGLLVRVGTDGAPAALAENGVRTLDMGGRPMKGWVLVDPAEVAVEDALRRWVQRGAGFARSLPGK
ncbi:MAG: TfoX/Sxy family protein [Actinomycetota bacterium]|nr:TfoX/Sxy family protein [Actinomycetota bacterium]MDP9459160.1 TfoX/Sxy family protein [Actinomycetota bacterium]